MRVTVWESRRHGCPLWHPGVWSSWPISFFWIKCSLCACCLSKISWQVVHSFIFFVNVQKSDKSENIFFFLVALPYVSIRAHTVRCSGAGTNIGTVYWGIPVTSCTFLATAFRSSTSRLFSSMCFHVNDFSEFINKHSSRRWTSLSVPCPHLSIAG